MRRGSQGEGSVRERPVEVDGGTHVGKDRDDDPDPDPNQQVDDHKLGFYQPTDR